MRYTELTDTIATGSREIFAGSKYGLDPGFIADADHIAVSNTDPITGAPAKLDSKRPRDSFKARSAQAQATSCVVRTHQGATVTMFGII
jgi:hypothetical protein